MTYRLLVLLSFLLCNVLSYANPSPLGLELDRSSLADLAKKYTIIKKQPNHWDGYNYYIDVQDIQLENISSAMVICNDHQIIQAVVLSINKNKFQEFYDMLANKYTIKEKDVSLVGNKAVTFTDDQCTIILDAPYLDFNMELAYITNEFFKKFTDKFDKERRQKKEKVKELL